MQRRNIVALAVFATFYIFFGGYLWYFQERIIYQPWPQDFASCPAFKDAEKVDHQGTRMYVREGARGVAVLYHGNAGSACDRDFYAHEFVNAGYGYVIPEYAGYSNDLRVPSHDLMKRDVEAVVSYMQGRGMGRVLVVGESIGSGMASYHTSLLKPDMLLLISPFASLVDVAQRRFWFYPTFVLVDNAFDNTQLLAAHEGPIRVVHGDEDGVISTRSGQKLFDALTSLQKEFISIEGAGHNDLFAFPEFYMVLRTFLGPSNP